VWPWSDGLEPRTPVQHKMMLFDSSANGLMPQSMNDCSSSILPLSSSKLALLRKGLLRRAIHRYLSHNPIALQLFPCSDDNLSFCLLIEHAIRYENKTSSELKDLFDEIGCPPSAASTFMSWLEKWLVRILYRDGNPRDKCAMGQALCVCLYRCADEDDYEVAENLLMSRADLEQRFEGGTPLLHVAADAHNGVEHSKGDGSRARMVELLLFHGANVHARLDGR
jgi:hypothetical protein